MKKQNIIIIVSALVMAGCAHHEREERQARYDESVSAPAYGSSEGTSSRSSATATEASQSATTSTTSEGKNPSDARTITSGAAQPEQSQIYSNSTSQAEGAATSPSGTVSEPAKSQGNDVEQKNVVQEATSPSQSLNSASDQSAPGADSFNANVQGSTSADQPVAQRIIEKIRVEPSLAGVMPLVRITVEDGKATLQGAVKTEEQKQQMEKTIQDVSGVTSVDNQLKVSATQNDSTNP